MRLARRRAVVAFHRIRADEISPERANACSGCNEVSQQKQPLNPDPFVSD
jgi:hypothetical protein